eukprot:1875778-Rhodomonas_salina.3
MAKRRCRWSNADTGGQTPSRQEPREKRQGVGGGAYGGRKARGARCDVTRARKRGPLVGHRELRRTGARSVPGSA